MKGFLFFIILKAYFLIIYCEDPHSFLDMYWEKIGDCLDAEKRLIDISETKIKKLSRTLIGITGQVLVRKTIEEGFTVEVVATRKALTGRWVPVDIQDITSKRHNGCELISVEKYYVGPVLKSAHIPPKCPIQEGTYTLVNDTMAFNLPRFIIPTCYKLEVKLFDTEENVFMCGAAVIKIVPTGEGPFPKCI